MSKNINETQAVSSLAESASNTTEISNDKISTATDKISLATFAGGCFWCMEAPFEKVEGVKSVVSGYTGGHKINPTYEEVSSGSTGHLEAVQISFDPSLVDYDTLLDIFWRQIDPTDSTGSFVDRGLQYSSAIFYHDDIQKQSAHKSKERLKASGKFNSPIVTQILELKTFYPAEDYHQDYYKKNPLRYKFYRLGSGRDDFIKKTWKQDEK
ncbi:MAG: peptide-methionine (S)-S-oxide reductase MsrA [Desulfamplus sp.]|nr:peptide-methionine (S)-S-oxide reductase MsrA [Desulfamplus sp.]